MRRIIFIFALFLAGGTAFAQQDPMYSQYMFNGLVINPAYTGSRDALSTSALFRRQWLGIKSAPVTQTFSLHGPTRNRINAFGFSLVNDKISYLGQTWLNFSYAYRIPVGETGKISLGLNATVFNYRVDWDKAEVIDPSDPVPLTYARSMWMPNVGTGIYYYSQKAYAGLSVPHMLINSLDKNRPSTSFINDATDQALFKRHYFATAGYVFDINPEVKIKPSVLFKDVFAASMEFDLNCNVYFSQRFGVGMSYRTGDGIVGLIDVFLTPQLRLGYAYDYPFTALSNYTSGSHEIMIGYDFRFGQDAVVSPRVF